MLIDRLLLAKSLTNDLVYSSIPHPLVRFSNSCQLVNWSTCQQVNWFTRQLTFLSTHQLPNHSSTSQTLVNSLTGQLVNSLTGSLVNLSLLVHFSAKVLTLWLRFFPAIAHQGAKNRFSRGVVLVQTGECLRMRKNEYLLPRIVFYTRFWAICSKMQCNLVQNAVQNAAKRSAFWC